MNEFSNLVEINESLFLYFLSGNTFSAVNFACFHSEDCYVIKQNMIYDAFHFIALFNNNNNHRVILQIGMSARKTYNLQPEERTSEHAGGLLNSLEAVNQMQHDYRL